MRVTLRQVILESVYRDRRHPGVVVGGLVASVALHVLLLTPIILGGATHNRSHDPDAIGTGSAASDGAAMMVELIEEARNSAKSADSAGPQPAELVPPASLTRQQLAELLASTTVPDVEAETESHPQAVRTPGNVSEFAALFGRYIGQVSARIERAWMKPRSAIGADTFICRVRILQDATGQVLEVTPTTCNGDDRWKSTLVQAIRSASPLPAPPDPRVFQQAVVLEFRSLQYAEGGSSEGFEPARLAMAEPTLTPTSPLAPDTNELSSRLHTLERQSPIQSSSH